MAAARRRRARSRSGVLRYLTTSFRITAGRVELRRGLLNRHVLSTPIDRVRTVDLTASLIHRVLGLTTVRIGTGTSSTRRATTRWTSTALRVDARPRLREELLHRSARRTEVRETAPGPGQRAAGHAARPGVAPVRAADQLPAWSSPRPCSAPAARSWTRWAARTGSAGRGRRRRRPGRSLVAGRARSLAVVASWWSSVLAVVGYVVANCGFTLTRTARAPGTCAAGCSRPGRPAWTRTGCAGSASASRSACAWPAAPGSPRS